MANVNEFVAKLSASDPDAGDNGTLYYYIRASNLFKFGSNLSRGSIIPSPFNVTEDGKLVTANYMAEYNQDRFVLDVVAKEKALPEREATTKVHVRERHYSSSYPQQMLQEYPHLLNLLGSLLH
jgi:hypothetical protein